MVKPDPKPLTRRLIRIVGITLLIVSGWRCQKPAAEDITPPVVTLVSPSTNLVTVIGNYALRARATDDRQVSGVVFMQDTDTLGVGQKEGGSDNFRFSWDTHAYFNLDTVKDIYATAIDGAGNRASSQLRSVVVDNRGIPPNPVVLQNVSAPISNSQIDKYQLKLTWSKSNEAYFQAYAITRGVDSTSATQIDSIIRMVTDQNQTTYLDTLGMSIQKTWFYAVYLVGDSLWSTVSNVKSGTTGNWLNVELDQATPLGKHDIQIHWTRSLDPYFRNYRVYRSRSAGVDTTRDARVFFSSDHNQNSFVDTGLDQNTNYTYQVFIIDTHGAIFKTNTLSARTLVLQPVAFVSSGNITKYSATVQWEPSGDSEFTGYRLTRTADTSALAVHDTLIQTTDPAATSFTDLNLAENTTYYFWIWTVDVDTAVTGSPLTVTTRAITPVILRTLMPGRYRFDLSWTQYAPVRNDFSAYVIIKTVNNVQSGVDTIRTLTTLSYADTTNIRYGINHTYTVATLDTNGGVGYSNGLIAEPERIRRANVTKIQASGEDGLVLQWNWATSPEPDFQAYRINRYTDIFVLQAADTIWLADTILETVPLALQWRQSTLVTTTTNIAQMSYTDNSIDQSTGTYAYQIMVQDRHGNQEGGEILGNFMAMELPTVVLAEATNITAHSATLSWTPAQAADLYLLYSNTDSTGMDRENSTPRAQTAGLQANITGLGSGVNYWFAVWAKDSRGNFSQRSNLVKVQTLF